MFAAAEPSYTVLKYVYNFHVGDYTVALNIPDSVKYHPMASMMCVLIASTIPNNNDYFSSMQAISNRAIVTQNKLIGFNGTKSIESDGATAGVFRSGATSDRPIGSNIYVGFKYFDSSLRKPIYAAAISDDTVTWVEEDGAIAGVARSGPSTDLPDSMADIYEGFMYVIDGNTDHFPVYAHDNMTNIEWYKADGTLYKP